MRSFFVRVVFPFLSAATAAIPLYAAPPQSSPPSPVRVNESTARLTLGDKTSVFSIELSSTAAESPAKLTVRVLSPDDQLFTQKSADLKLTRTPQRAELTLAWTFRNSLEDAARTRLLYEVRVPAVAAPVAQGTLSPAAITPDLFELSFTALAVAGSGGTYVAEVWATRPNSTQPVAGVTLRAAFGDEDPPPPGLSAHARTNSRGEARLTFHLPEEVSGEGAEFEIKGILGNFENSVSGSLQIVPRAAMLLSTDKPLYQPGQTLHLRALLLNDQHRAWPKKSITFVVKDPDDSTVFTSDVETSRFGIASVDWPIPATQKLGNYRVTSEATGEGDMREVPALRTVRITRYELPTFTVNVRPDQPYYLTGQNAQLTVTADYLFGKPVLRGHVCIVRESHRSWNYREQKWDIDEAIAQQGDLDAKNEFHAALDLAHDHADLLDNDYKRFEVLRFAAYLTDASSGRSQERHFDIRISRDAVHLYLIVPGQNIPASLPSTLYLSSYTPDGIPAAADVSVKLYSRDPQEHSTPANPPSILAETKVHTNKYGVAKVKLSILPALPKDTRRLFIALEAKTLDGRTGQHLESFYLSDHDFLRITPAKAILRPGDPIELLLEAAAASGKYRVDVIDGTTWTVLSSQDVSLPHGRAHVTFPASDRFSGLLNIAAYSLLPDEDAAQQHLEAGSALIFPHPDDLKLDLRPLKAAYRPGESATVDLRVRTPQGDATRGAFGLLVYDQAVEELARSEATLSSSGGEPLDPRLGFLPLEENSDALAGISLHDLLNLPPGQFVASDLEIVAEALLFPRGGVSVLRENSIINWGLAHTFEKNIHAALDPILKLLGENFSITGHYPADEAAFQKLLQQHALDVASLLDPWGRPYRIHRHYEQTNEVFEFLSDGPDKTPKTGDDFTALRLIRPFYTLEEKRLTEIVSAYHARTGEYLRDLDSFRAECERQNAPLSSFRDPWGTPCHFEFSIQGPYYSISAFSAGPDRAFRPPDSSSSDDWDDLNLFTLRISYFMETSNRISDALFDSRNKSFHFPDNAADFQKALSDHGLDWNSIRDPWGHPYDVVFGNEVSYADKVAVHTYDQPQSTSAIPVTRKSKTIRLVSNGPDGKPNTPDDFDVAHFSAPYSEEPVSGIPASPSLSLRPVFSGNSGAIRVRVTDMTGAVVQNAQVAAVNDQSGFEATGLADAEGVCLLRNLPPGIYHVVVNMTGFTAYAMQSVPVYSSNVTELEVILRVGSATQTVMVEASAVAVQTDSASVSYGRAAGIGLTTKSGAASGRIAMPLATPRLRKDFPETLFWQPEILTDRSGHTTVKFPLADSITTWKVSAIASTLDGHVATTTKEIRAFQPFFAELDPPKVLTVGDEIHLPVTVRNYLEKPQSISLDWAPEPWAESLTPRTATAEVAAGDYAQKIFSFRAKLPMKDARQRLSAYNRSNEKESDAIERQLRIHADGQERVVQASSVFSRDTSLTLAIPPSTVPGSIEAELVVYPKLVSHVAEAIEAILHRPYGCAEQTISSAYPSLLWLQLKKSQNLPASPYDERAQRFLNLAYARLLGYREPGGGFSYWGHGDPNLPLTAYALRFLTEASEFVTVDPDVPAQARAWLLKQLSPQGVWQGANYQGQFSDWVTAYYTSYVTRVLAQDLQHPTANEKVLDTERAAVHRSLEFLSTHSVNDNDPYRFALIVQAKLAIHEDPSKEIDALLASAHPEGDRSYWAAEHNTVFYGWGYAGRIETTALVLDALASAKQQGRTSPALEAALSKGTLFLLQNKDRYGVWYSTQATVNVLQSLVRQFEFDSAAPASETAHPIQILVDGKPATELALPNDARQITPTHGDLSAFLSPGEHRVELRGVPASRASAYLTSVYYLPWTDPLVAGSSVRSGDSESLRYSVRFDRASSAVGDFIRCTVHAERVGFHGYGMMLAEIGLPPGADVDRASLDALSTSLYDVQSYEIQPDRVVFYLWPRAGGTTFSFSLKTRFAMSAQSAESLLYDYYNPEARASVPPARFSIH